jgi:hypothetical protein
MPAIDTSQLHARINLLLKLMESPLQLVQELTRFYESYSDLTFQSGLFSVKAGDFPAYRTPVLMNRELETAFIKTAVNFPEKSLELIDLLALKPQLEPRQLACSILGSLPADYFDEVIQRLSRWALEVVETDDLVWMFKRGTNRIRQDAPEKWLTLLQSWLESQDPRHRQIAVLGLSSMINDTNLTSLPLIYKYLAPLLIESNPKIMPHLESILEKLVEKSEKETIFFLKQILRQTKDPIFIRMIRRNLPIFSSEGQESLKTYLRTLST